MQTACPISWLAAFSFSSMLAGDMFFPAALMISSFLRSTIRTYSVGIDRRHIAGVQPAIGVQRLGHALVKAVALAETFAKAS